MRINLNTCRNRRNEYYQIYFFYCFVAWPAIIRLGKRFRILSEANVEKAELWFDKHGGLAVLLGRMAPGIRELISIPAGIAEMNIIKFTSFTFVGSCAWSLFLTLIGFYLGDAWFRFYGNYSQIFDILGITIILAIITIVVVKYYRDQRG